MSASREHRIRLAGPWTVQVGATAYPVKLPLAGESEVGLLIQAAQSHWRRRFHAPTGLTSEERVYLEVPESWPVPSSVTLDEQPLMQIQQTPRRFELTDRLSQSHQLELVLAAAGQGVTLWEAPSLVIVTWNVERAATG